MRIDKKVKDKRIMMENASIFVAVVEYFRDTPERDGDAPLEKCFQTIPAAQKWLAGFPRDVWDGFATTDFNYPEPDERSRYDRERTGRKTGGTGGSAPSAPDRGDYGRQLVGSMRGIR